MVWEQLFYGGTPPPPLAGMGFVSTPCGEIHMFGGHGAYPMASDIGALANPCDIPRDIHEREAPLSPLSLIFAQIPVTFPVTITNVRERGERERREREKERESLSTNVPAVYLSIYLSTNLSIYVYIHI
jgi:hypothetical protein